MLIHCPSIGELNVTGSFNVNALPTTSRPCLQRLGCSSHLLVKLLSGRLISNLKVELDQPPKWMSWFDYMQAIEPPLHCIISPELERGFGVFNAR